MSKTAARKTTTARKPRAPKTQTSQAPALVVAQPTAEDIASAIATIDDHMETATVAGAVDHHTQLGSWHDVDSATVFEQVADQELLTLEDVADYQMPQTPENSISELVEAFPELFGTMTAPEAETAAQTPKESISDPIQMLGGEPVADMPPMIEDETVGEYARRVSGAPSYETSTDEPVNLEQLVAQQQDEAVGKTVFFIEAQITGREDFETGKSEETGKTNIFTTLKKVRNQMVTKRVAAVLNACSVDPGFINRTLHDGSRYNVYALGKLSDIVFGVSGGAVANAINIAIIKSLFICRDEGIAFTKDVAKACCSRQYRIDGRIGAKLERYTVSTSTAPTQASSTMQALATLGVVEIQGSTRAPIYTLTDRPLTKKLEAMLAAAA